MILPLKTQHSSTVAYVAGLRQLSTWATFFRGALEAPARKSDYQVPSAPCSSLP